MSKVARDGKSSGGGIVFLYLLYGVCRDGGRKAKAHLKLTLAGHVKGNKKSFCCYISSKRLNKESVRLLQCWGWVGR